MRYLALCLCLCAFACNDEDAHRPEQPKEQPKEDAAVSGGKDAGAAQVTGLARPSLPRPPKGLPAELRPPR